MTDGHGLAAVLFDLDGTLVDSEPLWDRALGALATHHGGTLSPTARAAMVGCGAADTMAIFYTDLDLSAPDVAADGELLATRMSELLSTELACRPGARDLLTRVRRAGLPTALVTSTHRRLVEVVLAGTLDRGTFDTVVCGDEVARTKPHPEPYQRAADTLGVPIRRCVAVEDSSAGLASASAAGAMVVAVPTTPPVSLPDGAHLVTSLADVDLEDLHRLAGAGRPVTSR